MAKSYDQLRELMDRLLGKLYSLSQPLIVEGSRSIGPLPSEIQTSADLMDKSSEIIDNLTDELSTQTLRARKNLTNRQDWENFIQALKRLKAVDDAKRQHLIEECKKLMKLLPGADDGQPHHRTFLPTDNDWVLYREPVIAFYNINKEKLNHINEMALWAAVYEGLAQSTQLESTFCGPDFDEFIHDFCEIPYNASTDRRGRYKRVEEVWKDCTNNKNKSVHWELFEKYLSEFRSHLPNSLP